ncbi:hypothetical protein [Streptomyces mirabilis]|nr:hypothetical protein [Streptomyces mirabilis]
MFSVGRVTGTDVPSAYRVQTSPDPSSVWKTPCCPAPSWPLGDDPL